MSRVFLLSQTKKRAIARFFFLTSATRFAIPRAFLRWLARGRIHFARVIALRLLSAIGATHFVQITLYQFIEFLSALGTFIL